MPGETNVGKLVAYVTADMRQLTAGLQKAARGLRSFALRTESHMARAGGAIARFSLNAARRMAAFSARMSKWAAVALAGVGIAATKLAMDAEEAENLFNVAMGKMAADSRKWAEELAKSIGLYSVEIKRNLGTFFMMIKNMGVGADQALKMSKALTALAYDMASLRNIKFEEAFIKIQAGITGEMEPLKRLGIVVSENAMKQWALKQGLDAQTQSWSESQKIVARYNLILEQTRADQGDLKRTADSLTNSLRLFYDQVKELGRQIGDVLLPYVGYVARAMRDWLKSHREQIAGWVESTVETLDDLIAYFRKGWQKGLKTSLDISLEIFKGFGKSLLIVMENIFAKVGSNIGVWIKRAMARSDLHTVIFEETINELIKKRVGAEAGLKKTIADLLVGIPGIAPETRRSIIEEAERLTRERLKERLPEIEAKYPLREPYITPLTERLRATAKETADAIGKITKQFERSEFQRAVDKANEWLGQMPEMFGQTQRAAEGLYETIDIDTWKKLGEEIGETANKLGSFEDKMIDVLQAYRSIYAEIGRLDKVAYEKSTELLYKLATKYKEVGIDVVTTWKWVTEQVRKLNVQWAQDAGNIYDGFRAAGEQIKHEMETWGKVGYDMAYSIRDALGDALYNMTENARNFKEAMVGFFTDIRRAMMQIVAHKLAGEFLGLALPSIFGGAGGAPEGVPAGVGHGGGTAGHLSRRPVRVQGLRFVPRAHEGLMPNEVLTVLERGEHVLTDRQMRGLAKSEQAGPVIVNLHVSAIDAAGVQQFLQRNSRQIASTVSEAMRFNHPMRRKG
jgi:hypothetical protein